MSELLFHDAVIPKPHEIKNPATISLHVLAKNASQVIGRLLDNVLPYIRAASFILNDTTDDTRKIIEQKAGDLLPLQIMNVTFWSHPDLYILDTLATYQQGVPLVDGEVFNGPFTNEPLLADWAAVRNLAWDSSCDWRLFLDADDTIADPESLPGLCQILTELKADVAACRYVFGVNYMDQPTHLGYRERLSRNTSDIKWYGCTHERLLGHRSLVLVEDRLLVRDHKDNHGDGVRVPGRCFKILYHQARMNGWDEKVITARHLAYMVQEARADMMPLSWIANHLVPMYRGRSNDLEEHAWVLAMLGEYCENSNELEDAEISYQMSMKVWPNAKTAFRLSHLFFKINAWKTCIDYYQLGLDLRSQLQTLDMAQCFEDTTKILVAGAWFELGEKEKAKQVIEEVKAKYPGVSTVLSLYYKIMKG